MTYLNLNQLSDKLGGRSRSSIYRDVEQKRIPAPIRIGSRLYWVEAQVDEALTASQADAAA
jgi:predicted DNA-binding transcriptional regulator AlpA